MTPLQKAFLAWQETFYELNPGSRIHLHTGSTRNGYRRGDPLKIPPNYNFACCTKATHEGKSDSDVCARERAWRAYIAIRDFNSPHATNGELVN